MSAEYPPIGPPAQAARVAPGHYRSVRGQLTAGRVGSILVGSSWFVFLIGIVVAAAAGSGGILGGFVVLGCFVFLGGAITEVIGWFGLAGLPGQRAWALAIAILQIVICAWCLVGPFLIAASLRDLAGLVAFSVLLMGARTLLAGIGFLMRRGLAARVAGITFVLATVAWAVFGVGALDGIRGSPGFAAICAGLGTLTQAIAHLATGVYFAENRPIPVDISAFT